MEDVCISKLEMNTKHIHSQEFICDTCVKLNSYGKVIVPATHINSLILEVINDNYNLNYQ